MLNIFPIQFLSLFAYFILRLFIGGILFFLGMRHYSYREELQHVLVLSWFPYGRLVTTVFILGELLAAAFILIGAFTQLAALAVILMSLKMLCVRDWFDHPSIPSKIFYLLLLGASITLFITGAGVFAVDLPL